MSTIKSQTEHLTLNADGTGKEIKFQANGVEKAKIDANGDLHVGNSVIRGSSNFDSDNLPSATTDIRQNILKKFYLNNSGGINQSDSITLSATEAPIGSWVTLQVGVFSGSHATDQGLYLRQDGNSVYDICCYVEGWYWYDVKEARFYISTAADRIFNIVHHRVSGTSSSDARQVIYKGYELLQGA